MKIPVYILAGGRSSRFGSDKARAMVKGKPLITHIADTLRPIASHITVIAAVADAYADLGLRTITDRPDHKGKGPLAGLDAALADLPQEDEWLLLLSCDLVGINLAMIETLLATRQSAVCGGECVHAVGFRGEYWEPLCALYHRSIHPHVLDALATNTLAMQHLLNASHAVAVDLTPFKTFFVQVNTPEDLSRYLRAGR